jgi:hypothetical protein
MSIDRVLPRQRVEISPVQGSITRTNLSCYTTVNTKMSFESLNDPGPFNSQILAVWYPPIELESLIIGLNQRNKHSLARDSFSRCLQVQQPAGE